MFSRSTGCRAPLLKEAVGAGIVAPAPGGRSDRGQQLDNSMKMFEGGEVATMLLVFIALVALADRTSAWLRKALG